MTELILNDQTFIEQFEQCSLDPVHFNHTGHIRLVWLYLQQNEEKIALHKVCEGIKAYAAGLDANEKFHLTITHSLVKLIALRNKSNKVPSWQTFVKQNRDLVDDSFALLLQYFSKQRLCSELARTQLLEPDLKAIT